MKNKGEKRFYQNFYLNLRDYFFQFDVKIINELLMLLQLKKGSIKWSEKNRIKVGLSTANPPHIHWTRFSPIYGIAENKLVITVAPQKDICPHGKT